MTSRGRTLDAADLAEPGTPIDSTDTLGDMASPPPPQPKIRNIEDLRRLNRRATQEGMYAGILGGGVLTFLSRRFGMGNNGLVATFLVSATTISFLTTRTMIQSAMGEHQAAIRAAQARAGGDMLDDHAIGDAPPPGEVVKRPSSRVAEALSQVQTVNQPRQRTMWSKGRGLDGEVEEENELRDPYMRPGVPRNV